MKKSKLINKILIGVLWIIIWQAAAMIIDQRLILVSPTDVIVRLVRLIPNKVFITSICVSALRIVTGFSLGMTVGTLLAVLAARFNSIREFLAPFMSAVKAVPVASFTILALFLIPSRDLSILVTFLIALPIVYSNILTGIDNTDRGLLEMASLFGISPIRKTLSIYFSQVLPYFKSASSVASGLSWKSGVAAELIVIAKSTIGERLYEAKVGFEMADLFAWTFIVILLSFLNEFLYSKLIDGIWHIIQKI